MAVEALLSALLLAASPVTDAPVKADRFVCAPLDSSSQAGALSYIGLADSLEVATWAGVVRLVDFRPHNVRLPWCREMAEASTGNCRSDGPPLPSGMFLFAVEQTLVGQPAQALRVQPNEGRRFLFSDQWKDVGDAAGCRTFNVVGSIDGRAYFSPDFWALDPEREYVLVVRPAPDSGNGIFVAAFTITEHRSELLDELTALAAARKHR